MEGNQEQPIAVRSRNEEDEEGEVEEEENECEPELPLSVQIEGKNRILSVAVISLTALVVSFCSETWVTCEAYTGCISQ